MDEKKFFYFFASFIIKNKEKNFSFFTVSPAYGTGYVL
jgi:hypothetical protein